MNRIVLTLALALMLTLSLIGTAYGQQPATSVNIPSGAGKRGQTGPRGAEIKPTQQQGGTTSVSQQLNLPPPRGRQSPTSTTTTTIPAQPSAPSPVLVGPNGSAVPLNKLPAEVKTSTHETADGKVLVYRAIDIGNNQYEITAKDAGCNADCEVIKKTVTVQKIENLSFEVGAVLNEAMKNQPSTTTVSESDAKKTEREQRQQQLAAERLERRIAERQIQKDDCVIKDFDEKTGKATTWGNDGQPERIECLTEKISELLSSRNPKTRQRGADMLADLRDEYLGLEEADEDGPINERTENLRIAFDSMFNELGRNPHGKAILQGFKAAEAYADYKILIQRYKTEMNTIQTYIDNGQTADASAPIQCLKIAAAEVSQLDQRARVEIQRYQTASSTPGIAVPSHNNSDNEMLALLQKPNDFQQRVMGLELKNFQARTNPTRGGPTGTRRTGGGVFSDDTEIEDDGDPRTRSRVGRNTFNRPGDEDVFRGYGLGSPLSGNHSMYRMDLGSPQGQLSNLLGTGLVAAQSGPQFNPTLNGGIPGAGFTGLPPSINGRNMVGRTL